MVLEIVDGRDPSVRGFLNSPTSKSKNHKNITTKNLLNINLRPKLRIQISRMMRRILPKASLEPKKLKVLKLYKKKMRERKL